MKKAILISIRPNWVAKILNGEKTIEIRKTMPKCDLPIDVYIYCTWGYKNETLYMRNYDYHFNKKIGGYCGFNGRVVAKFTLNKVEKISLPYTKFGKLEWVGCEEERTLQTISLDEKDLLKLSCLTESEIYKYLNFNKKPCGYAWHIDNLEIFDRPKELSEFKQIKKVNCYNADFDYESVEERQYPLTRAPQSWCYIEV